MRTLTRAGTGLALAALLSLTTACGDDKTTGTGDFAAYQACLEEHGVTLPGPNGAGRPSGAPDGAGRPTDRPSGAPGGMPTLSAEQQRAMQECASLRPEGGFGGPGGGQGGGPGGQGGRPNGQSAPEGTEDAPTAQNTTDGREPGDGGVA
ncbi:hypothetical protein LO762_06130 [Actinocorallia sp. API 0066]|uniref:hypothetical protein n=1 Tax=Actinocorallia sp. API 0066 TaxID=2896846 RepID=UPI001E4311CE|nr:hypothetical protein [Actinocorallia sp. API 0066]MCD0448774.1 hypothetical protein [Actinocorallia sp. API 0066]